MSDHNTSNTTVRETRVEERSGSGMAFIVGGLVVAVLVVAWVLYGGGYIGGNGGSVGGDTTNISVETPAPAADSGTAAPVESVPAPVETAPAPAPSGN